ncbi:MAG TPA: shikimate dehydrogenase [Pyrinomonadaceae bacterium]
MNGKNLTRICVPVCPRSANELKSAIERAAALGDIVELRLDCLAPNELASLQPELQALLGSLSCHAIVTLRPAEEGGRREIDNLTRIIFWTQFFSGEPAANAFADIEIDLALYFQERERDGRNVLDWQRVICSHHDFTGAPTDLTELYERMSATPAGILKIAVMANELTDCLPLFQLLDRARDEGRQLIAVAMGAAGILTRILGPARGSYLTYGALDPDNQTAPGQISAAELRELYRIDGLERGAMMTGLIGAPVAHSVSPQMHNAAFRALDLNAVYMPLEVQRLPEFARRMAHPRTRELDWNLRGLSVTAPHKSAIMEHLDWVEPPAREIGAVNTVVFDDDGLRGFNTDVEAFVDTLRDKLGTLEGSRCAIIGAGGAARGLLWGLQREGAKTTVFARAVERARPLAEKFGADCAPLFDARFDGFDVVVNTTPLGTRGPLEALTPASADQLRGARLAYDLVYNPAVTRFMREAQRAGCATTNGLSMLVAQAAAQFALWTGMKAPFELMREAAQSAIAASSSTVVEKQADKN